MLDWFRIDDLRTGDAINIAAVGKDLRAQKTAELELRHLNETLESRVAQRTAELTDASQKLVAEMLEHERLEFAPACGEPRTGSCRAAEYGGADGRGHCA